MHPGVIVQHIPVHPYLWSIMSQADKAKYWRALKEAGVQFDHHYREYTTEELQQSYQALQHAKAQAQPQQAGPANDSELNSFYGFEQPAETKPAISEADPHELPGQRLNTKDEDEPIRVDENGLIWYQEEVRKPAFPKPRGRRVLKYMDPGTKTQTAQAGEYTETFEVAGTAQIPSEVKITLPSYQVGIYRDPRFPFKIHTYQGSRGFDRIEVEKYYGGAELVPEEAKRVYVDSVLCYDLRTTVRAIETEFRRLQLQGKA